MRSSAGAPVAKRGMDVLLSLAGLLVGAPVMVIVAVWVWFDSPGPVIFRQHRVGRHDHLFDIYKFRTMTAGADGPEVTSGNDARITRAGRWLRRSKLDELPQLINVLKGEMSLVGPRPEVPRYMALYPDDVRTAILSVRPGITDRAAIEFRDEERLLAGAADPDAVYVTHIMPIKQRYYLDYVAHHSVVGDLRILWDTFVALWR